ncbi:hypothetical protein HK096_004319, partial [Nowakowskiella sp. JEL0078]
MAQSDWVSELLKQEEYAEFTQDDTSHVIDTTQDVHVNAIPHLSSDINSLAFSSEYLKKKLFQYVEENYLQFLDELLDLLNLQINLSVTRNTVASLDRDFANLTSKINPPFISLLSKTSQLERLSLATKVLRKVQRFLILKKRLLYLNLDLLSSDNSIVIQSISDLPKAAICIGEIELLEDPDLSGIHIIDNELNFIATTKSKIIENAEYLLNSGLSSQNHGDIASGLQILQNLNLMSLKTQSIIDTILSKIISEMQTALSVTIVAHDIKDSTNSSGSPQGGMRRAVNNDYSNSSWTIALWDRLENLMDIMYEESIKIYLLEKVLSRRKDPITHIVFLVDVVKTLGENMIDYFWRALSISFEKELRLSTKASPPIHQTFQMGFPKLLRLFHDFFSRIAVHNGAHFSSDSLTPESLMMLKPLHQYESSYVNRCLSRLLDVLNASFTEKSSLSTSSQGTLSVTNKGTPSRDDVEKIVRSISSELEVLASETSGLFTNSANVYAPMPSPSSGPSSSLQVLCIELSNSLWYLQDSVWQVAIEFDVEVAIEAVTEGIMKINQLLQRVLEPLLIGLTKELEIIILKLYKEDYGRQKATSNKAEPAASPFVIELSQRVRWMQRE